MRLHPKLNFVASPGRLPAGQRVYAIGDVHGCDAQLAALHDIIQTDLAARPIAEPTLIHLGDYIDRGPDSAGVLTRIGTPLPGLPTVNLIGNHEALCLEAARGDRSALIVWLRNGGDATLSSWRINRHYFEIQDLRREIPKPHWATLQSLAYTHRIGTYFFTHAGVQPEKPLEEQDPEDLIWIREPFLSWPDPLAAVIVHGHTMAAAPELLPHRIGIDTGACAGGRLTCAVLEADQVAFWKV